MSYILILLKQNKHTKILNIQKVELGKFSQTEHWMCNQNPHEETENYQHLRTHPHTLSATNLPSIG